MIVKLGKVTDETKFVWPIFTAYDGSPFPPLLYYQIRS